MLPSAIFFFLFIACAFGFLAGCEFIITKMEREKDDRIN